MSIAEAMIGEFSHESTNTRKMLERLPDDKLAWKPHDKSMTMGRLATHLAEIPEWAATIVNDETFDMDAAGYEPKALASKQEILDCFDKNVEAFKKVMSGQQDEHLFKNWKLISGGHTAVDMARVACLRGFILSHSIHHRGQLSVYLRENDVPLPAIYGPSADETM
jgi:uncharacterized damage-inducible protein DinB